MTERDQNAGVKGDGAKRAPNKPSRPNAAERAEQKAKLKAEAQNVDLQAHTNLYTSAESVSLVSSNGQLKTTSDSSTTLDAKNVAIGANNVNFVARHFGSDVALTAGYDFGLHGTNAVRIHTNESTHTSAIRIQSQSNTTVDGGNIRIETKGTLSA